MSGKKEGLGFLSVETHSALEAQIQESDCILYIWRHAMLKRACRRPICPHYLSSCILDEERKEIEDWQRQKIPLTSHVCTSGHTFFRVVRQNLQPQHPTYDDF
jgi:hypothetical protein